METWLDARLNLFVLGVIAVAFLLRVYAAGGSFLNPDEALHYIILNQRSAFWAYKISLTNAHPPLIYLHALLLEIPGTLRVDASISFGAGWNGRLLVCI